MPRTRVTIINLRVAVRSCRRAYGAAFTCLLWTAAAWPLSSEPTIVNLGHTVWSAKDGAPAAGIQALAQTIDGYLWMVSAGSGHLFRFDGRRFERVELPRSDRLSSMNAYNIFAPRSGGLWVGFTFGGAGFLKDGKLTTYTPQDGLPAGAVKDFAEETNGAVWALSSGGLARLDGAGWHRVDTNSHEMPNLTTLIVDTEGNLWISGREKAFILPKGETVPREIDLPFKGIVTVLESRSGVVWLQDETEIRPIRKVDNAGDRGVYSTHGALTARDDAIWIGSSWTGPLTRVSPDLSTLAPIRLTDPNNPIIKHALHWDSNLSTYTALEDREGQHMGGISEWTRTIFPAKSKPRI